MLVNLLINSARSPYYFPVAQRKETTIKKTLFLLFPAASIDQCCLTEDPKSESKIFHIMDMESYLVDSQWLKLYPNVAENFRLWLSCETNEISGIKLKTSPTALYRSGYLSKEVYRHIVHFTVSRYCEKYYKLMPDNLNFDDAKSFVSFLAANS